MGQYIGVDFTKLSPAPVITSGEPGGNPRWGGARVRGDPTSPRGSLCERVNGSGFQDPARHDKAARLKGAKANTQAAAGQSQTPLEQSRGASAELCLASLRAPLPPTCQKHKSKTKPALSLGSPPLPLCCSPSPRTGSHRQGLTSVGWP